MSNANDSVHPYPENEYRNAEYGLNKREYFAGLAMQGLCANSIPGSHHGFANLAMEAVRHADALLAELAK